MIVLKPHLILNESSKTTFQKHPFSLDIEIDFVGLVGVSVVEDSEDVFARAVDSFSQEEVCEEKFVRRIVQLIVSILKISFKTHYQ